MLHALARLAVACVQAGVGSTWLVFDAESDLAQSESELAGPLQPLGDYLRRLAIGLARNTRATLVTPPTDLPNPRPQVITKLRDAIREAAGG